jgi:transcriptional regulator with XRE-family HTH domain
MKPEAVAIGRRIKRLRVAKAMSQKQFAKDARVSEAAVIHWEKGRNVPSHRLRKAIADALGSTIDDIFLDRAEQIEAARDSAVRRSMRILNDDKSPPAAINAATNAFVRAKAPEEKSGSAIEEEIRQEMRTARDEFFRKLARLRSEEG